MNNKTVVELELLSIVTQWNFHLVASFNHFSHSDNFTNAYVSNRKNAVASWCFNDFSQLFTCYPYYISRTLRLLFVLFSPERINRHCKYPSVNYWLLLASPVPAFDRSCCWHLGSPELDEDVLYQHQRCQYW